MYKKFKLCGIIISFTPSLNLSPEVTPSPVPCYKEEERHFVNRNVIFKTRITSASFVTTFFQQLVTHKKEYISTNLLALVVSKVYGML